MVVHAFNASTREEYKMGGKRSHSQSQTEDLWRQDNQFQSEVEVRTSGWLLLFSNLHLESQNMSLGFYYLCYMYISLFY